MRAKTLMIQGTGSDVGKSVIVAALCRILVEDGYRVAPFKAQNMALNSFVTPEGGEIGRAQAVQAQACGIDSHVDMNPILIKPYEDTQAQIIFHGKPVSNMNVSEYAAYKATVFPMILESLNRLRDRSDVVVIEGAGSPAEINLKDQDIVNMKIAEAADAPVILVGDIDRGGVFASFVGTLELLEPNEKTRIAAFLINKFRGDRTLLDPGIKYLTQRTRKPSLGVVSYFREMTLPEEDALHRKNYKKIRQDSIRISVILLPHLSNFTDFDPLSIEPDVELHFVSTPDDCIDSDLVILPGSKSTVADLMELHQREFFHLLKREERTFSVMGICAGFQMLGKRILDPYHVESKESDTPGIGLIQSITVFEREKITKQISGFTADQTCSISGYQIHHGRILCHHPMPWFVVQNGEGIESEGYADPIQEIYGTTIHGIFDNNDFRRAFLNRIRERKKLNPITRISKEPDFPFQQWARFVRSQIDMNLLMQILNI